MLFRAPTRTRPTGCVFANRHVGEPRREVAHVFGKTERRHDLGSRRDVESIFSHHPVAVEADDEIAKRPVVHIDGAPPAHFARVQAERVAPIKVIVDQRRQKIMRGRDGVKVAREVKVDIFHRPDLGVAAARGSALHAEARAKARLAQGGGDADAETAERIAQGRLWSSSCLRRPASG